MTEHTPTPWCVQTVEEHFPKEVAEQWSNEYRDSKAYEMSGTIWCGSRIVAVATDMGGKAPDNAAFVVRAVNSHDALVAALEEIAEGYGDTDHANHCTKIRRIARAALAAAKEASE
jgi:hypothetical protein